MNRKRVLTLGILLGAGWTALAGRLLQIQLVQGSEYREMAQSQSVHRKVVAPKRGEILDVHGRRLVVNADVSLSGRIDGAGTARRSRLAPKGTLAGQLLGVVGTDGYGQSGLEFHWDRELRGTDGWRYARHDARQRYVPGFEDRLQKPVDGTDVRLTVDAELQGIVEHALERGVRRSGALRGVAIVIEPATGNVQAIANYPPFDPNTRLRDEGGNWKNHAIAMVYEPGSTFKAITAAALLEEGKLAPQDTLFAEEGQYRVGGQWIRDTHAQGWITFEQAMAHSSNIFFAKASGKIAPTTFYKYVRSFGFGMRTGLALPAEENGWVRPVDEWSGRTQATLSFGHEIATTPLQVAMAFAAIANGGLLMRPRILDALVDADGNVRDPQPVRAVRRVVSERSAATLRGLLRAVVDSGTAASIRRPDIAIAGKTGTAEKIDPETGKYLKGVFHSSFVGMAPAEAPRMVALVLIDEPQSLKYGGQSAAPVFREILDRMLLEPGNPLEAEVLAARAIREEVPAVMPHVVGLRRAAAEELLALRGLRSRIAGDGDYVLAQEPEPGSECRPGEIPNLRLGKAEAGRMPDLRQATLRDAVERLRSLGVDVEYEGEGRVLTQEPAPGEPLRPGSVCRLQLGWMG